MPNTWTQKTSQYTTLIAATIIVIAASAAANATSAPSGTYLNRATSQLMAYNNVTNTLTTIGASDADFVCAAYTDPNHPYSQCGECDYVPDTPESWQTGALYTYGRCANVNVESQGRAYARTDAFDAHPLSDEAYATWLKVEFHLSTPLSDTVVRTRWIPTQSCENVAMKVTYCPADIHDFPANANAPPAWSYLCVVTGFNVTVGGVTTVPIWASGCK